MGGLRFCMTDGQVATTLARQPCSMACRRRSSDRIYDTDWFGDAPKAKGIERCNKGRKSRNEPVRCEKARTRPQLHPNYVRPLKG